MKFRNLLFTAAVAAGAGALAMRSLAKNQELAEKAKGELDTTLKSTKVFGKKVAEDASVLGGTLKEAVKESFDEIKDKVTEAYNEIKEELNDEFEVEPEDEEEYDEDLSFDTDTEDENGELELNIDEIVSEAVEENKKEELTDLDGAYTPLEQTEEA